jgi:VWFA-related protein
MQAGIYACRIWKVFACLMGGAVLCAQQPAGIQSESGVYTLHEDTHLVLLDVTVTDKQGHPVAGLAKDDFRLFEDGLPQTIKFFEEHAPVDAAEIARQKAAAMAGQPPNTFTDYEPFTGRPVTVLLLNELFSLPLRDLNPLHPEMSPLRQRMIDTVQSAPPDTPFAIYLLDSELRLVQPVTTNRALLLARIEVLWKTPHFGSERMINPNGKLDSRGPPPAEDIPVRRSIMSDAMQHLASSLKGEPGRKNLYVFTGGFQCSVVGSHDLCPDLPFPNDSMDYQCGLMDTLEQGRMSIYRYYPMGGTAYGFGCSASADLGTSPHYYTLYYTPTNGDWSGKYHATTVEVADKGLHLAYRKGYYGTPENAEAHYYTAKAPAPAPVAPGSSGAGSGGPTITATVAATGTADSASPSTGTAESKSTQQIQLHRRGSESPGTGAAAALPSPAAAVFSVQVIPADTTMVPATATSAADKQKQEYRQLTLHFSMPANEFKMMQSDAGQQAARLEISAVGYSEGRLAPSNGSQGIQVIVNFNGAADPRIAKSTITETLTLNVLEHGKNRWLYVSVRDLATGQLGSMVIPMGQVRLPEKQ